MKLITFSGVGSFFPHSTRKTELLSLTISPGGGATKLTLDADRELR
jgi:hypothetical protein